jgi:multicomponent Na+:H+ antiporter subunit G
MQESITIILLVIGALFMLIGGLGVLRFPDLYMRISASTKASTLGAGFALLALAVHFNELGTTMRAIAAIIFLVITGPVAAHLISRAAYSVGIAPWEKTVTDALRGRYDRKTGILESAESGESERKIGSYKDQESRE